MATISAIIVFDNWISSEMIVYQIVYSRHKRKVSWDMMDEKTNKRKSEIGPGIVLKKNKDGEISGYKFMCCVGRDEQYKQIWRTCTISKDDSRLEAFTPKKLVEGRIPKKLKDELNSIKHQWDKQQKEEYERTQEKKDKTKITLSNFIDGHWWPDHVKDGSHTPSSISFYQYMSDDIKNYFGDKFKLNQLEGQSGAERVKRYIKYLNTEARLRVTEYREISIVTQSVGDSVILSWEAEKNAMGYQILRKSTRGKKYVKIASTTDLTYTDTKSTKCCYQVKARFEVPGNEPYSQTTIIRHYQTFRNILNYALQFGYLQDDPCKYLAVKDKPKKETKKIDFLAPDEARKYIACLENESLYWKCLQNVLITTGLRRGECVGLQWGDIDKEKLILNVRRNVTVDKTCEEGYHVGETKSKEERTVPISKRLYDMLSDLKVEREEKMSEKDENGRIIKKETIKQNGYVFCRDGYPYVPCYPTEPTRWTAKFVKRHGLHNVSPHDLRHTAATLALESGNDIKQVQELLGHRDPATTMQFYAGVTEEAKRRTVEGIESILVPSEIVESKKAK